MDDLRALVDRFNLYVSKEELGRVVKAVDTDGDQCITKDDIVEVSAVRCAAQSDGFIQGGAC